MSEVDGVKLTESSPLRALGLRDDAHVGPGFTVRALGERREGTEYHLGILGRGSSAHRWEGFGSQGIFLRLRASLLV